MVSPHRFRVAHSRMRAPRSARSSALLARRAQPPSRCRCSGSLRSPNTIAAACPCRRRLRRRREAAPASMRCTHSVQPSARALAARHVGLLVVERLVHERARLVRAGHHAIAAADADVLVHQHDAVGALERGAGRADVDAGRLRAVLAHHRRRLLASAGGIAQVDLADPLRVGLRPLPSVPAVFLVRRPSRRRRSRWRHLFRSISRPQRTFALAGRRARAMACCAEGVERDARRSTVALKRGGAVQEAIAGSNQRARADLVILSALHRSLSRKYPMQRRRVLGRKPPGGSRFGRFRPRGVAFETIDRDRRIGVARSAEMPGIGVGHRLAVGARHGVAGHAALQAEFRAAARPSARVSSRWCRSTVM